MPYVGNSPAANFASVTKDTFSGDGSTTAFTLDIAPSSVFDIEVFVENVRQDPNSAYNISGTTLTSPLNVPSTAKRFCAAGCVAVLAGAL